MKSSKSTKSKDKLKKFEPKLERIEEGDESIETTPEEIKLLEQQKQEEILEKIKQSQQNADEDFLLSTPILPDGVTLGSKQKKAFFIANFLKKSADLYIESFRSNPLNLTSRDKDFKDKLIKLLDSVKDKDLSDIAVSIRNNLDSYTHKMNSNLSEKVSRIYNEMREFPQQVPIKKIPYYNKKFGTKYKVNPEKSGEVYKKIEEDKYKQLIDNSLYVVTARRINQVVDSTIGKSMEEKEKVEQAAKGGIMQALKYMGVLKIGSSIRMVVERVMHQVNRNQAISDTKKLGITDAHEVLQHQSTPIAKSKGAYKAVHEDIH